MFTTALSTVGKTWKLPKCLLTDKWIKKIWVCVCVCVCVYKGFPGGLDSKESIYNA